MTYVCIQINKYIVVYVHVCVCVCMCVCVCVQGRSKEFQKGVSNNRMNIKLGSDSPRC